MIRLLRRPFFGTPISIGEAILWIGLSPVLGAAIALSMAALPGDQGGAGRYYSAEARS